MAGAIPAGAGEGRPNLSAKTVNRYGRMNVHRSPITTGAKSAIRLLTFRRQIPRPGGDADGTDAVVIVGSLLAGTV